MDNRNVLSKSLIFDAKAWEESPALVGKKVLVVEDDFLFTEMLRIALEKEGLLFRSAARVADAIDIIEEWHPDAIISDLGLPDEDGFTFIEKIRSLPSLDKAGIPALALSGYGHEEGNRALAAGFHAYKTKPVEPSEVVAFLTELFKSR